jgi:hypothetical protein
MIHNCVSRRIKRRQANVTARSITDTRLDLVCRAIDKISSIAGGSIAGGRPIHAVASVLPQALTDFHDGCVVTYDHPFTRLGLLQESPRRRLRRLFSNRFDNTLRDLSLLGV